MYYIEHEVRTESCVILLTYQKQNFMISWFLQLFSELCQRDVVFPDTSEFESLEPRLMIELKDSIRGILCSNTHVTISKPAYNLWNYYNRKSFFRINLVAVVN